MQQQNSLIPAEFIGLEADPPGAPFVLDGWDGLRRVAEKLLCWNPAQLCGLAHQRHLVDQIGMKRRSRNQQQVNRAEQAHNGPRTEATGAAAVFAQGMTPSNFWLDQSTAGSSSPGRA